MPLTTSVYIHDRADYRIVFAKCVQLTGAPALTETSDDGGMISTPPGLGIWTWVEYGQDGPPLRISPDPHTPHCAPACGIQHAPACWIQAVFDTDDDYRHTSGGPGRLHQRLVAGLGRWLDEQGINWSWRSHDDGILHRRHHGLDIPTGPGSLPAYRALTEPETVRPLDGDPVTLRPCPPWCMTRHFTDGEPVYTDHGYHHYGPETEIPTSHKFLGTTDGPDTIIRATLKSWTHPLHANPGPPLIELNLGTADGHTEMCAEITPAEARATARALVDLAHTAEPDGPQQADQY